jgi:hypothetical protein
VATVTDAAGGPEDLGSVPWRLAELVEAAVRAGQVGVSAAAFERLAHLRTRHDALSAVGVDGFAERARRELLATGLLPTLGQRPCGHISRIRDPVLPALAGGRGSDRLPACSRVCGMGPAREEWVGASGQNDRTIGDLRKEPWP